MLRRLIVSLCGLAVLLRAAPAGAQDGAAPADLAVARAAHAARLSANPAGLSLHIRTRDGRARFAQGEVIALDLEFRDTSGARYLFDTRAYDRSGRLGIDRPVVAPAAGVEDPLRDFYRALGFGFIGGGLSAPPAPLDGPRTLAIDLNEWVRFVRPGTYAAYVESGRFREPAAASAGGRRVGPVVVSNLLVLTIAAPAPGAPSPATLPARALRFADSAAAARELARRLLVLEEPANRAGSDGHDIRFGLLATPYRGDALAALRDGLASATRAVDEAVPQVAAFLDVMIALPRQTGRDGVDESPERVRDRMARHACRLALWRRDVLAAGLRGGPDDAARAIVAFSDAAPPHCPPLPPVDVARVLPPVFDRLPPAHQRSMLSYRWGQVAGPGMLPVLRRLVSPASTAEPQTRDLALVRLGELAPREAARVSRDDVRSGRFQFSARSLRVPPEDVPALAQALAALAARAREASTPPSHLQDGVDTHARGLLPTLARLGARRELASLRGLLPDTPASCPALTSVIAFALAADRERGEGLLRESLRDSRSRCREHLLDDLARWWPQRVPETAAIDALWHQHRRVATSAARALARIGTAAGRQALWRRLDEWRARWDGRADDLRPASPHVDDPVSQELGLERALRDALLRGRGWLATFRDRQRVRESCVTEACREEYSPFNGGPPPRLVLVQAEEWTGETVYQVDGHAFDSVADLVDRLALYPKTTAIAWHAGTSHSPVRAAALYEAVAAAGATRGVRVLAHPPPAGPPAAAER